MNLLQECEGAKRIIISGHVRPDGDCVGACLSMWQFLSKKLPGTDVKVYLEKPADIFADLLGFAEIVSDFPETEPVDVCIALDCNEERLGEAVKYFRPAKKRINIDHHVSNTGCGDVNLIMPEIGSTCEVLYGLMEEDCDYELAKALYTGIIHDTGVFQYSNTTPRTLEIGAKLISFGFDFPRLIEETFYERTFLQTKLLGKVLTECKQYLDGQCVVGVIDCAAMESLCATSKDLDGIVNHLRNVKGAHCAIFLHENKPGEYKISLRSDQYVNVSKVAVSFGGGGHVRAAGCTLRGSADECTDKLLACIKEELAERRAD